MGLAVEVYDNSLWNFFQGNRTYKEFELNIDRKKPMARVISNSHNIKRGGAATVVVQVGDENMADQYITFNDEYKFELFPFEKKGYYAAVIAWPVAVEFDDFKRVNLVAVDKANNNTIKKVSLKNMSKDMITKFNLKPFKRLKGSKTFAGFAEKRKYYYNKKKVDDAWHLGMDWASVKHAEIKISNPGKVIFDEYLGIYGNTLIVDHKLGIQSLYAHTSKFNVQKDDEVIANEIIANTGSSGAVFGDHLHFGMLVQGIEVNPLEWLDRSWVKSRVLNILAEARQEIRSSK